MGAIKNALAGKSKTINFNALFGAGVAIATALGYPPPAELAAALQTIMNIGLRFITNSDLGEK